jgi:DNA-binding NtrC family response regulator
MDLLAQFRARWPHASVVVFTGFGSVENAVESMRRGACDFVQKPFQPARLVAAVRNAVAQSTLRTRVDTLSHELRAECGFGSILGAGEPMRLALDLLRRAARTDVPLLLSGESGTGKELAARAVHAESARRDGPFVAVNCGDVVPGHVEAELFGRVRVAPDETTSAREGAFERADGGTLFLDSVDELRPELGVRVMRAIQDRVVERGGSATSRRVNVRIMASTTGDLRESVRLGMIRDDFYYRLAVFPVRLPPLAERGDDVPLLAHAFLARCAARHRRSIGGFTQEALTAMRGYAWPGNVRELMKAVERGVVVEDGEAISLASLPEAVVCAVERSAGSIVDAARATTFLRVIPARAPEPGADEIVPLAELERLAIIRALEITGGDVQVAAARLGVSRATMYWRAERYRYRRAT